MEKKEYSLNEIFENQLLNQLFESSEKGLEYLYKKMYGEPEEVKKANKDKEELENLIEKIVKNKDKQKQLWLKLDDYEGSMLGEMHFWKRQAYKLGFLDKIFLNKEIEDTRKVYLSDKKDSNIEKNSFFDKCIDSIMEYICYQSVNVWSKREDYKELMNKMSGIKDKYPNVRIFLEDGKIVNLTENELKAVYEYINLDRQIEILEKVEAFKLGIKEGWSL